MPDLGEGQTKKEVADLRHQGAQALFQRGGRWRRMDSPNPLLLSESFWSFKELRFFGFWPTLGFRFGAIAIMKQFA